jgi:hypothetical protein
MPEAQIRKRGGAKYWRTIHPKGRPDVTLRVAIVPKAGKRGGHTLAGEPREKMYA